MKRLIMILVCAMIAYLATAQQSNKAYRRQLIPNCGIMGANADAYVNSDNLLSNSTTRFTNNGNEIIKEYKTTYNVIAMMALTYDKIYDQFGEGTARLLRDYSRIDLYDQTHTIRLIFRKIRHNIEGKDDLWLVVRIAK